jgi:hypothetical protein
MKYAQEIIELMGAYPGREFRMREIVKYVAGKKASTEERSRTRKGIFRVLQQLKEVDSIHILDEKKHTSAVRYIWKK